MSEAQILAPGIRWSYLSPPDTNPGADGIFKALESLPRRDTSARAESSRMAAPEARP